METIIIIGAIVLANALCSAAVSFTIAWTGIFEGTREWVASKSKFFGELIFCPWCLNFYVLVLIIMGETAMWYEYILPMDTLPYLFYAFFLTFTSWTISGICHYVLLRAYEPVKRYMLERAIPKE